MQIAKVTLTVGGGADGTSVDYLGATNPACAHPTWTFRPTGAYRGTRRGDKRGRPLGVVDELEALAAAAYTAPFLRVNPEAPPGEAAAAAGEPEQVSDNQHGLSSLLCFVFVDCILQLSLPATSASTSASGAGQGAGRDHRPSAGTRGPLGPGQRGSEPEPEHGWQRRRGPQLHKCRQHEHAGQACHCGGLAVPQVRDQSISPSTRAKRGK